VRLEDQVAGKQMLISKPDDLKSELIQRNHQLKRRVHGNFGAIQSKCRAREERLAAVRPQGTRLKVELAGWA
jgi:hypothetical protein